MTHEDQGKPENHAKSHPPVPGTPLAGLFRHPGGLTVAVAGAGGKHTLMEALARSCVLAGQPAIVTSTTHLHRTAHFTTLPTLELRACGAGAAVRKTVDKHGIALVISTAWGPQMWHGIAPAQVQELRSAVPEACILVKADGARKRLLKAPSDHEPRWPQSTDLSVLVLSLAACGHALDDRTVHRMERITTLTADHWITASTLVDVIMSPGGYMERFPNTGRRALYLSACDSPHRLLEARRISAAVGNYFDTIVAGDTPSGRWLRLSGAEIDA